MHAIACALIPCSTAASHSLKPWRKDTAATATATRHQCLDSLKLDHLDEFPTSQQPPRSPHPDTYTSTTATIVSPRHHRALQLHTRISKSPDLRPTDPHAQSIVRLAIWRQVSCRTSHQPAPLRHVATKRARRIAAV